MSCSDFNVLPEFVAACGFANAKAPGFEADDSAAAAAAEERGDGFALVASGDPGLAGLRLAKHDNPLPNASWRGPAHRA